ncbi:MAG TPA: homogentisate 1,2-dioxygenase [Candidatus Thioglobus sp.]|jgi:homogentisate 1,2-dioxygenase|nr:homogentisate 1,2-dioxygenase [Candidatus Thioglobus sp.]
MSLQTDNRGYQSGFGNHFETEALAGALPVGRNSPQKCAHGLYAEQFSGSAFTAPRENNRRSWLYRIRPSAITADFEPALHEGLSLSVEDVISSPNQMRWDAQSAPTAKTDFIDGLFAVCGNGSVGTQLGVGVFSYAANSDMDGYFYNSDGEMLIVPQQGALCISTEMGVIDVAPKEICVIPRGLIFQVMLEESETFARGYVCENYGAPFELPNLGPIGANGLASSRDFLTPVAGYEDIVAEFTLLNKFGGQLWQSTLDHSPLNVVAWHGNYAPYKYDLSRFNVINSVSFDHCDPSIFTVLTSPSSRAGVANCDFVIFPPRWMVAEDTFRPPWFHRNIMSEFMGLIEGAYDAKAEGFVPGGASLHNTMSLHGPDVKTFEKASHKDLEPEYLDKTMAFMFESNLAYSVSKKALSSPLRQTNYHQVWRGFKSHFDAKKP